MRNDTNISVAPNVALRSRLFLVPCSLGCLCFGEAFTTFVTFTTFGSYKWQMPPSQYRLLLCFLCTGVGAGQGLGDPPKNWQWWFMVRQLGDRPKNRRWWCMGGGWATDPPFLERAVVRHVAMPKTTIPFRAT